MAAEASICQWDRVIHAWVKFPDPARCEQHLIVPRTKHNRRDLIRTLKRLGVTRFTIHLGVAVREAVGSVVGVLGRHPDGHRRGVHRGRHVAWKGKER